MRLNSSKILRSREAVRNLRKGDGRIVFTNGCFDILHRGHIRLLQEARRMGDILVVGVNSDASVRSLKGEGRPVTPEEDRLQVVAAIEAVDFAFVFPESRVDTTLELVRPYIWVKGADYTKDTLDKAETFVADQLRVDIRFVALSPAVSTTLILDKARAS